MRHGILGATALLLLVVSASLPAPARAWEKNPAVNDLALRASSGQLRYSRSFVDPQGVTTIAIERNPSTQRHLLVFTRIGPDGQPVVGPQADPVVDLYSVSVSRVFAAATDGAGGAFVGLLNLVTGDSNYFLRVYHVDASGSLRSAVAVSPNFPGGAEIVMEPDGHGGVIVAWRGTATDPQTGAPDYRIQAQRLDANLVPRWSTNGVAVAGGPTFRSTPRITTDGLGGAIVAWLDLRNGDRDIYANHVTADGRIGWNPNGIAVSTLVGDQEEHAIASDGAGGAIIVFETPSATTSTDVEYCRLRSDGTFVYSGLRPERSDRPSQGFPFVVGDGSGGAFVCWVEYDALTVNSSRVFVQSVDASGRPRWPSPKLGVTFPETTDQHPLGLVADSAGGVVVAFAKYFADFQTSDLYVQRFDANGLALWGAWGLAVERTAATSTDPMIGADDDRKSFFVSWVSPGSYPDRPDERYVQRVDRNGFLGDPAPRITAVEDLPQDQGGRLIVEWQASDRDTFGEALVQDYLVLRRLGGAASEPTFARDDHLREAGLDAATAASLVAGGWELVTTTPALLLPAYSYTAPSYGNLTANGAIVTEFLVLARVVHGIVFESVPVSGTSIDNIAPGAPAQLLADQALGKVTLSWSPPFEPVPDLREYRVYRSPDPDFTVGPETLVTVVAGTSTDDALTSAGTFHYRVTAMDVHDNESAPSAFAVVSAATAVEGPALGATRILGSRPNPFNPATELAFELAEPGEVDLAVFDARGRQVVTLVAGTSSAGRHTVRWDGRGSDGVPLASGVYFARLVAGSATSTYKLTLVQ